MKLHAFKDRLRKNDQAKVGHHAMDVYRVVSMMTEEQYDQAKSFLRSNASKDVVKSAVEIVSDDFRQTDGTGILKILEHPLYRADFRLDVLSSILTDLLPPA